MLPDLKFPLLSMIPPGEGRQSSQILVGSTHRKQLWEGQGGLAVGFGGVGGFGVWSVWGVWSPSQDSFPLGSMAAFSGPEFPRDADPGDPTQSPGMGEGLGNRERKWDKNGK